MTTVALSNASLILTDGADPVHGEPLSELVNQYNLANTIVMHLTRVIFVRR